MDVACAAKAAVVKCCAGRRNLQAAAADSAHCGGDEECAERGAAQSDRAREVTVSAAVVLYMFARPLVFLSVC